MRQIILILVSFLSCSAVYAVTAKISVEPATTVDVGEEVFFSAAGSSGSGNLLIDGTFEWEFGDGYVHKFDEPYYYSKNGGITVTHFYMNPGVYTATLVVTDAEKNKDTETVQITVQGKDTKLPPRPSIEPLLELKFEGNLEDKSPNRFIVNWQNGQGAFMRGKEGKSADLSKGAYIEVEDSGRKLSGMNELSVSFWAKKRTKDSYGCLLYLGPYSISTKKPSYIEGVIETTNGRQVAKHYNLYDVDNLMWHHYALTYDGEWIRLYIDGEKIEQSNCSKQHTGIVITSINNLLIGKSQSGTEVFDGYIDEVKIYNKALSRKELYVGFELWHADFHGHIAQYIYAQIPGQINKDPGNKLKVTVEGDQGYSKVILEKDNLKNEEKFLFRNSELPSGNYMFIAQLLDSENNILDGIKEKFAKPYDGIPKVGINENNAICIDGKPFFPVFPFGLNYRKYGIWSVEGYINSMCATGWPSDFKDWKFRLRRAESKKLSFIGPVVWKGLPGALIREGGKRNADITLMQKYINQTKDRSNLLMWSWTDEPDLGGSLHTTAPVVRSWAYQCHKLDPQHLVYSNFVGYGFGEHTSEYNKMQKKEYCYLYNSYLFGGKRALTTDVYAFDYYPYEKSSDPGDYTVADMAFAVDKIQELNYGLTPFIPWIEVCDINVDQDPPPTAAQCKHIIWINVVHGCKGIGWFNHFKEIGERYPVMAEFVRQITELTPVVLGPEPDIVVTHDADNPGSRVDFMVRKDDTDIYIFAVRVTEPDESSNPTIHVTFTIKEGGSGQAIVYDENRTVNITNGSFADSFAPNAVHIYRISNQRKEGN